MEFPVDIPFARLLGLELLRCSDGEADVACDLRPDFCNSWGVAHGGVTMTLLDLAMSMAAFSSEDNTEGARCGTIEMKTSFMQPGKGYQTARARILHRTKRMAFCEASLFDEGNSRTAHATGTFIYLKRITP